MFLSEKYFSHDRACRKRDPVYKTRSLEAEIGGVHMRSAQVPVVRWRRKELHIRTQIVSTSLTVITHSTRYTRLYCHPVTYADRITNKL